MLSRADESVCPSTTIELISFTNLGEQTVLESFGMKAFKKSSPLAICRRGPVEMPGVFRNQDQKAQRILRV